MRSMGKAARATIVGLALLIGYCTIEGAVAVAQSEDSEEEEPPKPPPEPGMLKVIGAYGLVLAAFGTVLVGAARTFGGQSYAQGRLTMTNLLRTNPHQAERVAQATHYTWFSGISGAMKMAQQAGSRDPRIVPQCTAPGYDSSTAPVNQYWKGWLQKAKMAGMAAAGGVALAVASNIGPTLIVIFAVLTGLGALRIFLYKMEVESTITRGRAEVLPELDRAIVDGRYVLPPR